jgi:hypothetical protein
MLDVEERICQKLAKIYGLSPIEIKRIERSQFKQVTRTFNEKQGKAFAIPYLGEFDVIPARGLILENKNKVEEK